ncbi:WhiB family transcriptional regulator [Streptomyces prunicolor]|uniref:WhiB family transcriptional regulator n=1 Tax=Streptomyces prunicolor TaxID=67348 RepID=UPI003F4CCE50
MNPVLHPDWHEQAVCAGSDRSLFDGPRVAAAQAVCGRCPVRAECLHDALDSNAPTGVWGGLTRKQRRALPALPADRTAAVAALRALLAETPDATLPETGPGGTPPVNGPSPVGVKPGRPGGRYPPKQREDNERRTIDLLKAGATYAEVKAQVGISEPSIHAIRKKAGLPPSGRKGGVPPRSKAEALAESTEPYGDDGHVRWTGSMAGRMPQLHAEGAKLNATHVAFEAHHGRTPTGRVNRNCGETACIAGAHLTDHVLRSAPQEAPVTIRALQDLLTEIDSEGGPQAARDNRLRLTTDPEGAPQPMATDPAPVPLAPPPLAAATVDSVQLPLGKLLKWGEEHHDPKVQKQAVLARAALTGLRMLHAADQELAAIATEVEQLQKRLAELRAREAELAPRTKRKSPSYVRDYDAREVRVWAEENGVDCPSVGQIPKRVLDAWRAARVSAAAKSGG